MSGRARIGTAANVSTWRPREADERAAKEKQKAKWREENPGKEPTADDVWSNYSKADGHFFLGEGLTIEAAIPGEDSLGSIALHLVYRDTEGFEYYARVAEIAAEFCEEALALDAPCVHWSS